MGALQVFNTPEGQEIRIIESDGGPWFVASDVCRALDITDTSNAVRGNPTRGDSGLDEGEWGKCSVSTSSGEQGMLIVSESGLYSLVFKSRKPEAKAFKRWVTHEVLPSIRKTGRYEDKPEAPAYPEPELLRQEAGRLLRKAELLEELRDIDNGFERPVRKVRKVRPTAKPEPAPVHDSIRYFPNRIVAKLSALTSEILGFAGEGTTMDNLWTFVLNFHKVERNRCAEMVVSDILKKNGYELARVRKDKQLKRTYVLTHPLGSTAVMG